MNSTLAKLFLDGDNVAQTGRQLTDTLAEHKSSITLQNFHIIYTEPD